jgi:hypothetical protein
MIPFSEYTPAEMEVYNAGMVIIQKRKNSLALLKMLTRRYTKQRRDVGKTSRVKQNTKEKAAEKRKNDYESVSLLLSLSASV